MQTNKSENCIDQKVYGMIGLAEKAGKVSAGEFSSEKAILSGKAKLCIIASDASENTRKHFSDMCSYRSIAMTDINTEKEKLGQVIGKKNRSVITVNDDGFSGAILKLIVGGRADGK